MSEVATSVTQPSLDNARGSDELAFLPAALEVQESPPSPVGRIIIFLIVAFFCIALVWAYFGKIDIVAVAPGKVVPTDRVKVIQPLEIGMIEVIHVEEGQRVKKGDPLITLDSTQTEADQRRMGADLLVARMDASRQLGFEDYLKGTASRPTLEEWPPEASVIQKASQTRLLEEEVNQFFAQDEMLLNQELQREAERRGAEAEIEKLEQTLPMITQRADSLRKLWEQNLVSEANYLELEQARIEAVQDGITQRARIDEAEAALATLGSQKKTMRAEALKLNLIALQESRRRISVLEQELVKATQRYSQQVLSAPLDGVVTDLSVFTVGGVVTPAETLMNLVPAESPLEVQALVLNKDIGFVIEGQAAEVKIDTFNFTKYGIVEGEVVTISSDAMSDERLGLVYQARVLLSSSALQVKDKMVELSPGMSATVEIKTDKRRILDFFLSPLLRYRDESIRER